MLEGDRQAVRGPDVGLEDAAEIAALVAPRRQFDFVGAFQFQRADDHGGLMMIPCPVGRPSTRRPRSAAKASKACFWWMWDVQL